MLLMRPCCMLYVLKTFLVTLETGTYGTVTVVLLPCYSCFTAVLLLCYCCVTVVLLTCHCCVTDVSLLRNSYCCVTAV